MAAWLNVTLTEGSTAVSRTWALTSDDAALNLGSVTVSAVIKPSEHVEDDDASAYVLTVGDGVTIVNPTAGTVRLTIPAAVVEAPSTWLYKILVNASDQTEPAILGWITVTDT